MCRPERSGTAEGVRRSRLSLLLALAAASACESAPSQLPNDPHGSRDASADAPMSDGGLCPVPSPAPDAGAPVSYANTIFPLLSAACAGFGCHDGRTRIRELQLGLNAFEGEPDDAVRDAVYDNLLAPSTTAPELPRVTPGSPRDSLLMLKLDGCHDRVGLACRYGTSERPCGVQMPPGGPPMSAEQRDRIRLWIAQGARR